jgi:hypothetical protein
VHLDPDAVHPRSELEEPPPGRSLRRWVDVLGERVVVAGAWLPHPTLGHRRDQQGERHHHQPTLHPTGLLDQQRRPKAPRVLEQPPPPVDLRLAFVTRDHVEGAPLPRTEVGAEDAAGLISCGGCAGLDIRASWGSHRPVDRLERRLGRRAALPGVVVVVDQGRGRQGVRAPALGQGRQSGRGLLGRLNASGLPVPPWRGDRLRCALLGWGDCRLGTRTSRLGIPHQPALGPAIVASLHPLLARGRIPTAPLVPREGWTEHLFDPLERTRETRDAAERLEMGRMVCVVALRVGPQRSGRGRVLHGRSQRRSALREHRRSRRMALPAFAHKRPPAVLGYHPCYARLLQRRAVILGGAMRPVPRLNTRLGHGVAAQGQTGRVQLLEASGHACVAAHRQGTLTQQPITAIGGHLCERAPACAPMAHLGLDALTQQPSRGVLTQHWGGTGMGRSEHPTR